MIDRAFYAYSAEELSDADLEARLTRVTYVSPLDPLGHRPRGAAHLTPTLPGQYSQPQP